MSARRLARAAGAVVVTASILAAPASAAPSRIRITAPPGQSLLVHGEYPRVQSSCVDPYQPVLHARYRGTIEVVRQVDGSLSLIGELPFEEYIKGIAEVPRDWPMEALKAQVVAARSYALNRLQTADPGGGYDLCATTECQVYVGMKVEAGPWGSRWVRAVDKTAGQVLLYDGVPAVTYYSSTSPGRTFDVEDVFGGEALPYLRGREEPDDGASPLSRWRVEVPFTHLARFLTAGGVWPGGAIRSVRATEGGIRVAGAGAVTVSKDSLRDALNGWAGCLMPGRYPTTEPDGYQLPQTVPSSWYRVESEGDAAVLIGRGWGHGIGMVQWGAYGKAKRGLGYGDILAAYYGGLRPQAVDLPGTIRILVAEGLRTITVDPSAAAQTRPLVGPAAPWRVTGAGRLRVQHASPPRPQLEVSGFRLPRRIEPGVVARGRLTASDEVAVTLEFSGGSTRASVGPRPYEEGPVTLRIPVPDLPPGPYDVRAVVGDGVDVVTTDPVSVTVGTAATTTAPPSPSPFPADTPVAAPPPSENGGAVPVAAIAAGIAAIAVIALLVLTVRRRKGLHRW